jgi:hypothetical protein
MLQDGEAAIFILDSKFDPSKDIYQIPPPSGNLAFLEQGMNRIQQDTMAMIGMTTPQDVFNPEVMAAGNSGVKLQIALTPNQIIQDNTVRNAAEGLKQALWLVWRTLIQYGDDYGVKKLAQESHPSKTTEFLDFLSWDDMNFCDRKQIQLELAIGMKRWISIKLCRPWLLKAHLHLTSLKRSRNHMLTHSIRWVSKTATLTCPATMKWHR